MALASSALPTLYEYYTGGGITQGLNADTEQFKLNNRSITLYSGAMHYFRVPKQYWRDRLRKMRAAGLNAVETYVSWNLHEPEPGTFDFGNGGTDMQDLLDIEHFLKLAQEEDLLAIVRPGPYICAEWEFGGLPSWLLREEEIKVRTSDEKFMKHVRRFFNVLMPLLAALQFTKGGPIVALQVENEYGSTQTNDFYPDHDYLKQLKDLMTNNGIVELLVSSDPWPGDGGTLPEFLKTVNFAGGANTVFNALRDQQPGRPIMAMEYWTGWFDHWTEEHHTRSTEDFRYNLEEILAFPGSVNMYMFHGGTNFGFMNGGNLDNDYDDNGGLQPTISSYDYDAPLTENGDYTGKYEAVVELLKKYATVKTHLPTRPGHIPKTAYETLTITKRLVLADMLAAVPNMVKSKHLMSMEMLPINNNSGQSFGYIVYRKTNVNIAPNSILKVEGRVCDTLMVLVDGKLVTQPLRGADDLYSFGYWRTKDGTLDLGSLKVENATIDFVVEHWARINFGHIPQFNQKKGLWQGNVILNDKVLSDWEIYPLEFRTKWINSLQNWKPFDGTVEKPVGPALYSATLNVTESLDTFIDMTGWEKGIVAINGFVLGRHCSLGPQRFLYLPAPYIKKGSNEIVIFEHFEPNTELGFSEEPIYRNSK